MSTVRDGGPAFPEMRKVRHEPGSKARISRVAGMTLRDYFASKAMHAAAVNPVGAEGFSFAERAAWAYQQADAMIAERAK